MTTHNACHILISGQTLSGKTTTAKRLIKDTYLPKGRNVFVLDSLGDPFFTTHADYCTDDPAAFMRVLKANPNAAVFVDEGGETVGRYNQAMEKLATQFRHLGHNCHFISQRPVQLPLTIRANCSGLFLFSSCATDAKTLAEDFVCPDLLKATSLPQGRYLFKTRFGPMVEGNIFNGPEITA